MVVCVSGVLGIPNRLGVRDLFVLLVLGSPVSHATPPRPRPIELLDGDRVEAIEGAVEGAGLRRERHAALEHQPIACPSKLWEVEVEYPADDPQTRTWG